MKRLVVLVCVFASSTLANGELIFTVNGEPQPDEITLMTSDTIELDLELSDGHDIFSYAIEYRLTNAQAEFIWDEVHFPADFDWQPTIVASGPQYGQIVAGQYSSEPVEGPDDLMRGLILHSVGDVPVDLIVTTDPTWTIIDGQPYEMTHVLWIIPEPMTVLLLGLGGLALLKKRAM